MTVQMNHGTNGVVTLQAPTTGTHTVTIPARDGTLALGGPAISFNSAGTVLSGSGATVTRVSAGVYDITRTTAASNANYGAVGSGQIGQSFGLSLDGTNDYVSTTYTTAIGTGGFTVSFWARASATQNGAIVSKRNADEWYVGMSNATNFSSSGTKFIVYDGGRAITSSSGYNDNVLHHVAYVRDNSGGTLYVDGASVATSGTTGVNIANTSQLWWGTLTNGNAELAPGYRFNGTISDGQIWTSALTSGSITSLYQNRPGGTQVGSPVARWKFNETSGTTADDPIGGYDGTLVNGPAWVTISGSPLHMLILRESCTITVLRVAFYTSSGSLADPSEASLSMLA
jgi:hypothetical protein